MNTYDQRVDQDIYDDFELIKTMIYTKIIQRCKG